MIHRAILYNPPFEPQFLLKWAGKRSIAVVILSLNLYLFITVFVCFAFLVEQVAMFPPYVCGFPCRRAILLFITFWKWLSVAFRISLLPALPFELLLIMNDFDGFVFSFTEPFKDQVFSLDDSRNNLLLVDSLLALFSLQLSWTLSEGSQNLIVVRW